MLVVPFSKKKEGKYAIIKSGYTPQKIGGEGVSTFKKLDLAEIITIKINKVCLCHFN